MRVVWKTCLFLGAVVKTPVAVSVSPAAKTPVVVSATGKACSPVNCHGKVKKCAYGYQKKDGCEICKCDDPCNPIGKVMNSRVVDTRAERRSIVF